MPDPTSSERERSDPGLELAQGTLVSSRTVTPAPVAIMKARYNCLDCPGYCCSHSRIAVSDFDIARLAKHFGLSVEDAKQRFTYRYKTKEVDEQILRHQRDHIYKSVCRFFDTDKRRCTVYEARPNVCRRYPYGNVCGYYSFLKFEREHQDDKDFIPSA